MLYNISSHRTGSDNYLLAVSRYYAKSYFGLHKLSFVWLWEYMRVITGKYKGRTLIAPKNVARPTLDRMKETLFNIVNAKLQGATVLDLFAGSGQLAIECLSRGASRAILCDNSKDALSAIKANFDKIGETPEIIFGDFRTCLQRIDSKIDLIFVDPPYNSGFYYEVLRLVDTRNILSDDGLVICEHSAESDLPQSVGDLQLSDCRKMGTVKFSFYKRREQCE